MSEGTPFTNLLKLMKNQGYNKDTDIIIGVIKKISPLQINLGIFDVAEDDVFKCASFVNSSPNAGDRVLVLVDNNDFYVIDKVVD